MKKATAVRKRGFFLKLRSRHPSSFALRMNIKLPFKAVYRHGSITVTDDTYEINSVQAVRNSSSKFSMKACFTQNQVKTANWFFLSDDKKSLLRVDTMNGEERVTTAIPLEKIEFPLVAKLNMGSRGRGMEKINTIEEFQTFITTKFNNNYYFETFHNYVREYRLHVSKDGCFYTCRKMIKTDTPDDKRWFRNDSNCVWIMEDNEQFDKPVNWDAIVAECVKALLAVGLDVGACDVRVQSAIHKEKKRENPEFIIVEINSAPAFGQITLEKYEENLPRIFRSKYGLS